MILLYIMAAMFSAVLLSCSVAVVFRAGEKELICKYEQEDTNE
jgi:hypothetical protein